VKKLDLATAPDKKKKKPARRHRHHRLESGRSKSGGGAHADGLGPERIAVEEYGQDSLYSTGKNVIPKKNCRVLFSFVCVFSTIRAKKKCKNLMLSENQVLIARADV
jgi:hypothetical protein